MVQVSDTWLNKTCPMAAASATLRTYRAFPQQISIFYAGKIAPQLGAFIQLTYDKPGRNDRYR